MENSNMKSRLASFITSAQTELDHLKVQLALGKMEAADLFEQSKKELLPRLEEISKAAGQKGTDKLNAAIDNLRLQLALGKATALDAFMDQQEKITNALDRLEQEIKMGNYGLPAEMNLKIRNELYKFQLKTDILKIKYKLGKIELKEDAENRMNAFKDEIADMFSDVKEGADNMLENAEDGLKSAYAKLKSVFR